MARKVGGLGKGLDALFGEPVKAPEAVTGAAQGMTEIPITAIDPNPYQPRTDFDKEALQALADSIRDHGVLQPILVSRRGERYQLVAGERRWRAARLAGLKTIPAQVTEMDDRAAAEAALVENLQREDLNALEEAEGIQRLMKQFHLTQQQAAERLGRSRPAIANSLRLLTLPEPIQQWVREDKLSGGHARCLAGVKEPHRQLALAQKAMVMGLSVRQLEGLCRRTEAPEGESTRQDMSKQPEFRELASMLREMMGTRVTIHGDLKRGKITLDYYSREDLERIFEIARQSRR